MGKNAIYIQKIGMAVSPKVFRVATYNFACLHSTTQSDFWGNFGYGHMETLKVSLIALKNTAYSVNNML